MDQFSDASFNLTTLTTSIVACRRDARSDLKFDITTMKIRADQAMYDAKSSGKNRIVCRF